MHLYSLHCSNGSRIKASMVRKSCICGKFAGYCMCQHADAGFLAYRGLVEQNDKVLVNLHNSYHHHHCGIGREWSRGRSPHRLPLITDTFFLFIYQLVPGKVDGETRNVCLRLLIDHHSRSGWYINACCWDFVDPLIWSFTHNPATPRRSSFLFGTVACRALLTCPHVHGTSMDIRQQDVKEYKGELCTGWRKGHATFFKVFC